MSQHLLVLALAILSFNLAQAQVFDKKPFQQRLLGKVLLNAPMTAQEIDAMEPACLQIGMGKAGGSIGWNFADRSHEEFTAVLNRPEYAMVKVPSGEYAQWFHHYCSGMLGKYRFVTGRKTPHDNLRTWRNEMQYCLRDSNGKSWVYENRTRKELAEAQYHEKEYGRAVITANEVLTADPSFAEAYVVLADSHVALKRPDKALAAVTEGFRHAPNSKGLKRRYKELGGKMPLPEPYAKAATPDAATAPAVAGIPAENPTQKMAVQQAIQEAVQEIRQPAKMPDALSANSSAPEKPVNPANPYCRFCP
jgi:tetratricopeptide (TPR) repeat protein